MVRVVTCNVNGLRKRLTRYAIFREIETLKCDVAFLQESFITNDIAENFKRMWGGTLLYTKGTTHSLGNIILISNKFDHGNLRVIYNSDRILGISFTHNDQTYLCLCVYYPNECDKKIKFNIEMSNICRQHYTNDMHLIIAGDFNCTIDNKLDNLGGNPHSPNEVLALNRFVQSYNLYDAWRLHNFQNKEHTWRHKSKLISRRIDYIFCSENVMNKCTHSFIYDMPFTDHRAVVADILTTDTKFGPNYWKFNNALLENNDYVQMIKNIIQNISYESGRSPHIDWDYCKQIIKESSIVFGKQTALIKKDIIADVRQKLYHANNRLLASPDDNIVKKKVAQLELELNIQSMAEAKGSQIRSKVRWIEEGEKNTKFFLTLEKIRGQQKIMTRIKLNNTFIDDQNLIMEEQKKFYADLYKRPNDFNKELVENFTQNLNIPNISLEENQHCDKEITVEEIEAALKNMKNDSSPGSDGLTAAWYRFFWDEIKHTILKCYQYSFEKGYMSNSQRKGIIKLLYKGKGAKEELTNWRPITLTNVDYKILAKVMSNRMKSVIKNIVHEDQNGYIKSRSPSCVLRTLDDIVEYTNTNNIPGALLSLDYSKAFDTISKEFMIFCFKKFGFGNMYTQWVSVLNKNTISCISYCGWMTEWFKLERGIRQGCPFSPLCFILACEILSLKIRQTPNIKGIKLPCELTPKEIKILQYADDSTLLLEDEDSINESLHLVELFSQFSGLKAEQK